MTLKAIVASLAEDLNVGREGRTLVDFPGKPGKRGKPEKNRDNEPGLSMQTQKKLDRHLGKLSRMIKRGTFPRTDRPKPR